jgi:hypothetical protein
MKSLVDRVRMFPGVDPIGAVAHVAAFEVAAQNHAVAEGYADPYPSPFTPDGDRPARARAPHKPRGVCATPTVSGPESQDGVEMNRVAHRADLCYANGGDD